MLQELSVGEQRYLAVREVLDGASLAARRRGRTNLCERYATVGLELDGALAEHAAVPASTCLDVSERGLSSDALALAQPMSIAVHSTCRGRLEPQDVAVVIGTGGLVPSSCSRRRPGRDVVVADLDASRA